MPLIDTSWCIERLAHTERGVAEAIRVVMVAAYAVEAALLGVEDFVPLYRTAQSIAGADATFWGVRVAGGASDIVAVAEVEHDPPRHIGSLVVHPAYFRRGLATALIQHVVAEYPAQPITVSTGALNRPALALYAAQSFVERRRWSTPDGIPMVTLGRG